MICFNCGYKIISPNIEECQLCGMKFPRKCITCGTPNPILAKFCFNCGQKMMEDSAVNSIENFHTLTENRKRVAVIFADVSGFTVISEKLDPEELREIINECFNYITRPVYELGGTVDKYIGDCVMILFGAKYSHEDDVKRAVICAMRMMDAIDEYSKERLSPRGLKLELAIGVNYGLVVTGSVGNYFDKDYTVMGDVVNTAQRLQTNANKGEIFVSEAAFLETENEIDYTEAKEIMVKNKKEPIRYYSPITVKTEYNTHNKILIDREHEINILNDIYTNSAKKKCITIIGERGIGKTSLMRKFIFRSMNNAKQLWVDCNPVHKNRVFNTVSNILYKIMNINFNDSERVKKNRLASFLDYILEDYSEEEIKRNYDFLGLVMGINKNSELQSILSSMAYIDIENEILKQLLLFFKNAYKKYNIVVVVDDLQWADSNSIKIIGKLVEKLTEDDCMFLFTSRYKIEEIENISDEKIFFMQLKNLSKSGVNKLACNLLKCSDIDEEILNEIMRVTNGNPLFIEEFIKSIKNECYIESNIAYLKESKTMILPESIEKLILANITQIDDETKKFLQVASIFGKDFELSWVKKLLEELTVEVTMLKKLTQMNIISLKYTRTTSGVLEKFYTFNQDTVRETIYESILNNDKKYYHKMIVELIESKYNNNIENYYELLCFHSEKANLSNKAKKYYYKTAIKYKEDFIFESALEYYEKFINNIDFDNIKNADVTLVTTLMDMGYIYGVFSKNERAFEYLNKALDVATLSNHIYLIKIMISKLYKEKGEYEKALDILNNIESKIRKDSNTFGQLLQLKCSILSITGSNRALDFALKSEEILLKTRDYESLSETMSQAGAIYFINGSIDDSLYYLNKAYKYAQKVNNLRNMSRISGNLGVIYHASGRISNALEFLYKSIEISKKISNIQSYISASINLGILYMDKGIFNKAKELFEESLQKSCGATLIYENIITLTNFGDLMQEIGDNDKAYDFYNKSIKLSIEHNLPIEENVNYIGLAKIFIEQGLYEKAIDLLINAYSVLKEAEELSSICDYFRLMSKLEIKNDNIEKALEHCEKALHISKKIKSDKQRVQILRENGNIHIKKDAIEDAINLYNESITLAEQLESDYEVAKGYYMKYQALCKLKRIDDAEAQLQNAIEAISKIDTCKWTTIITSG